MPFYRYSDPNYNKLGGSFPGTIGGNTYARVNVTSGGDGGGDGSANVDGAKVGGPNAGTFLVAFGEQGISAAVNRGLAALAKNTDALDDVVRASIPRVARISVTLGAPSNDVPVTGDVFVGESGMANTQANRDALVHVERSDGTPIAVNGVVPTVTLLHDGLASNVVGTAADGFRNGATVRLSAIVPAGTYTVFIGQRTSYANLVEARLSELVAEHIRGRAYDANLWKSLSHGLDEKYRKSTRRTGGDVTDLDVAGSGAVITRDGKALTVVGATRDWDGSPAATDDPLRAIFASVPQDRWWQSLTNAAYNDAKGGNVGYVHVTSLRSSELGPEKGVDSRDMAAFLTVNPVNVTAANVGGDPYYTYLGADMSAVLNPAGGGGNRVQVAAPNYFRSGGKTGIALKHDMLLIERTESGVVTRKPYLVESFVDDITVTVSALGGDGGTLPPAFPVNGACKITWLQVCQVLGGKSTGTGYGGPVPGALWPSMLVMGPMRNRLGAPEGGQGSEGARFIASSPPEVPFAVGHFDPNTGFPQLTASVFGNGNADFRLVTGNFRRRSAFVSLAPGANNYAIDLHSKEQVVFFHDGTAGSPKTITITAPNATHWSAFGGDEFVFYVSNVHGTSITLSTPASWIFSDGDNVIPSTPGRVYKFVVQYVFGFVPARAYVTRTDYQDTPL